MTRYTPAGRFAASFASRLATSSCCNATALTQRMQAAGRCSVATLNSAGFSRYRIPRLGVATMETDYRKFRIRHCPQGLRTVRDTYRRIDDDMNNSVLALECERRRDVLLIEP